MVWIAFGTISGLALLIYALMDTPKRNDDNPKRISRLESLSTLSAGVFNALR
jgi:hypothetical protein